MATSKDYVEYIIDQIGRAVEGEHLAVRKMFGEYALYYLGTPVGLVCNDTLFIKVTPRTEEILSGHEIGEPYPGAKPWYKIDEGDFGQEELLRDLLEVVYEEKVSGRKKEIEKK